MPNALDHRGVVCGVGEDDTVRNLSGQRGNSRLIGDVSRREEQRSLLAVKVSKLTFQEYVVMARPGNVARPAGAGSDPIESLMHRCEDCRMLAHAQIIVGAPDGNLTL